MTKLIVIGVIIVLLEIVLEMLRTKLYKKIKQSPHKEKLSKMYLPREFWKPYKNAEWTPIKYVFKREHRKLNDRSLTKLSDILLILYLISWTVIFYFVLILSVHLK